LLYSTAFAALQGNLDQEYICLSDKLLVLIMSQLASQWKLGFVLATTTGLAFRTYP